MADFVAVIRRTVDGLSENTLEMRERVYEKARGAVRRQLENMNPRPSDEMINRQLSKLESAITEVESEYTEALPALEEPEAAEQETIAVAPEAETPPVPVTEPEEAVPGVPAEEDQPGEPAPAPLAPEVETASETIEAAPAEQVPEQHWQSQPETVTSSGEEYQEAPAEQEAPETAPAVSEWPEPAEEPMAHADQPDAEEIGPAEPHAEEFHREQQEAEPTPAEPDEAFRPVEAVAERPAPSEWALPEWDDGAPVDAGSEPQQPQAPQPEEAAAEPERLGLHPTAPAAAEPARAAETESASTWTFDDNDPFTVSTHAKDKQPDPDASEWSWPVEKAPAAAAEEERAGNAWDHIDDLLGFEEAGRAQKIAAASATSDDTEAGAVPSAEPPRPASYRATPKETRFSIKRLVIGLVVVLLLGGGGYAYWVNREAGNAWLSDMIARLMPDGGDVTPPAEEDAPAGQPGEQSAKQDGAAAPEPDSTKFTQRLLPDGTERDEGPAGTNGKEASQEGKSVAAQTEAGRSKDVEEPQQASPSQAAAEENAPADLPEISLADGEKMFLYEERLGQSSPTAIPGTVSWSIKEESPGGDAKPEPAIQAQIVVPDRGLTALMTIKRNVDPSLPASHVIEFVFSLPPNFEGGSIEGVQRVSMKRTEQDRGDSLIAVPAKITDDFHMIALNDFAEAAKGNTELLRSRSWMDIPITYRNGRRALLTLEKGTTGAEVFNKVLQAWSGVGSTAASGQ